MWLTELQFQKADDGYVFFPYGPRAVGYKISEERKVRLGDAERSTVRLTFSETKAAIARIMPTTAMYFFLVTALVLTACFVWITYDSYMENSRFGVLAGVLGTVAFAVCLVVVLYGMRLKRLHAG